MLSFGVLSSFVDFLVILPLIYLGISVSLFRTAWFVESSLSEIIITFIIRSKKPFFKSRPSAPLLLISLFSAVFIVAIAYTSIGASVFGFVRLNASLLFLISGALLTYVLLAELLKKRLINLVP